MPKIRSIHPEVCIDPTLADTSASAERTFVRLWTHLDDEGRARDDARLIKAALYPLHDLTTGDVEKDLIELAEKGLIVRYEVDGGRFLSAKPEAWGRLQRPRWRTVSKLPAPPGMVRDDMTGHSVGQVSDVRRTGDGEPPSTGSKSIGTHDTERNDTTRQSVGRSTAQVVEGEGEGVGESQAAAVHSRALTVEQRRQRIDQAITILTDRHLQRTPTTGDPDRHRQAVHRGKLTDHHQHAHQHLAAHPELTPDALADLLEPDSAPPAPYRTDDDLLGTSAPPAPAVDHSTPGCPCDGDGWWWPNGPDNGAARCPGPATDGNAT